jgi:CRP/FNR family transcriptional regulator
MERGGMPITGAKTKPRPELEDPLLYLPCSRIVAYKRGQVIYDQEQAPVHLYLVIDGLVKVATALEGGEPVVIDVYQVDEFFGESALLRLPQGLEIATALLDTKLMTWTNTEIEEVIVKRPRLGLALLQMLVQRTIYFGERIKSYASDHTARRLARWLIRLSERLGRCEADGSVHMAALTHELLAQYVGTSREIVTHHMIDFRRKGYLRYTRKGITLYRGPLEQWLRQDH